MKSQYTETYYCTRYATTSGIRKIRGTKPDERGWIHRGIFGQGGFLNHHYFATLEQAQANAELKRQVKIKSLRRQIERVKSLTFSNFTEVN